MSYSAANDLKEQVRAATDIVALLGSYLHLEPQGRGYVALCPFHDDTRPSLQVNPERQNWKCWPCESGGDVFSFVMRRESVDFAGALRILAERAGIELRPGGVRAQPGSANDKATLYQAMAWAEQQFHRYLLESQNAAVAREYLAQRQINAQSIEQYRIGFAPNEWQWLTGRAKSTPYSPSVLEALGLLVRNDKGHTYDRFRGRVMFPIRDPQDRPIAVGGRILPEYSDGGTHAKYINSPETRLYTKREQLYGLNLCREPLEEHRRKNELRNIFVMEGYTDVIAAKQSGVQTPVAVCGTALGEQHISVIRRFADRVTLVLDGDEAGQKRAAEVLPLFLSGQIELRVITLPDGLDPCDFVLQQGGEALLQSGKLAPDALDFSVARETEGIDLTNDTQRAHAAMMRILTTLAAAPRRQTDSEGSFRLREQQILSRLARMFRVHEQLLRDELTSLRSRQARPAQPTEPKETSPRPRLDRWEKELFTLLILTPDAIAAVIEKISIADMRTDTGRSLLLTYQEIESTGELADYQRVMSSTEDPDLKNILVELADAADRMQPEDVELALRELLAAFAKRRVKHERTERMASLESGELKEEEQINLLKELIESKKLDST